MKAAIYARVSTLDQTAENQLLELRKYSEARGWTGVEYVDHGVSGTKESRPALDALVRDAKRRKFDALVCWRLDRLGRNLRHLILLLDELTALGIGFVTLGEGIDTTSPTGRLVLHVLGAISEFERERIRERVMAGLQRARTQGKALGRPKGPRLSNGSPAWRICRSPMVLRRSVCPARRSSVGAGVKNPFRQPLSFRPDSHTDSMLALARCRVQHSLVSRTLGGRLYPIGRDRRYPHTVILVDPRTCADSSSPRTLRPPGSYIAV